MFDLYLITRLDGINGLFIALTIVSFTATVVGLIAYLVQTADNDSVVVPKLMLKYAIPTFLIACPLLILTPNSKQALMIYGVGSTIDYLKENPTAKQLPDKCIKALDSWLTNLSETENKTTEENNDGK